MKRKVLAMMLIGAMAASMAACGSSSDSTEESASSAAASSAAEETEEADSSESELAAIQEKGEIIIGITDFEPMDYKDADGNWIGFDADLANAFAESLGVTAVFQEIEWDNKILELDGGSIDCVWNGMTLTDEVTSAMDCTDAYLNNAQIVIVKADVADQYQDAESLADLNFAVESGSAGEAAAQENGFNYTGVTSQASALMEIESGTADAAIIDSLMAAAMVGEGTSYDDLTYTVSLSTEEYGVGFRKGSDLTEALNEFFAASMEDGTMEEIADTYGVQAALIK